MTHNVSLQYEFEWLSWKGGDKKNFQIYPSPIAKLPLAYVQVSQM